MQDQNMENSAYMAFQQNLIENCAPVSSFQHEPITHQSQKEKQDMTMFKHFVKNIEFQERKKTIQKAQKIKKQLLEAQIAAKNFRSELLRPSTHVEITQPRNSSKKKQNTGSQKKIVFQKNQKSMSIDLLKPRQQQNLKLQMPTLKGEPYVNKQKMMKKTGFSHKVEKQNRAKQPPRQFSGIKLRNFKLPELTSQQSHSWKQKTVTEQKPKTAEKKPQMREKQVKKQVSSLLMNPVLKTYDPRYFGIQRERKDFEKAGKDLLQSVMEKYWCYQSLENEEVYDNFQDFLTGMIQQTKQ